MRFPVQLLVAFTVSWTLAGLYGCGTTTVDDTVVPLPDAASTPDGASASDAASSGPQPDARPDDASSGAMGDADSGMKMVQTCVPLSCFQSCGVVPNGCGGMMTCGPCGSGETCNSAGHCVAAEGGTEAGTVDAGTATGDAAMDGGAPDGCVPACAAGHVCVSQQVQGGCVGCNDGPPSYSCALVPTGCGATVDCTCAQSLCPAAYRCMSASASGVVCVEQVP